MQRTFSGYSSSQSRAPHEGQGLTYTDPVDSIPLVSAYVFEVVDSRYDPWLEVRTRAARHLLYDLGAFVRAYSVDSHYDPLAMAFRVFVLAEAPVTDGPFIRTPEAAAATRDAIVRLRLRHGQAGIGERRAQPAAPQGADHAPAQDAAITAALRGLDERGSQ